MSLIVSNINIDINDNIESAIDKAKSILNISTDNIKKAYIYKKSLDARKKDNIHFVVSVAVDLINKEQEKKISEFAGNKNVTCKFANKLELKYGSKKLNSDIIIAGMGPAGLFAGYLLAKEGYNPIIVERGEEIEKRVNSVNNFWNSSIFNKTSNVQFGEGGAGTFSDGKLTTRISDERCKYVLDVFSKNGAPDEILYTAKPHIGTDKLRDIIVNIRKEIIANGGKVFFNSQITDVIIKNDKVSAVVVNNEEIPTENFILSIGHSARDTFEMLYKKGIFMEPKSFSIGARVEQLQKTIDKGLYGKYAGNKNLPKGEYQLSYIENDRCAYTFCMCPGGYVVPSASEEHSVVTNGMSEFSRNAVNANSALVVSVTPDDFGKNPLDGMNFQREIEQTAYKLSGNSYKAPAMNIKSFLDNDKSNILRETSVKPSYNIGVVGVDFNKLFPKYIVDMMKIGLTRFDRKLKGFSDYNGVLTAPETRTSSPVRITRNEKFQSINIEGIYPCGEGAGYAGGIMSAAVDGIKVAEQIISEYSPK